MRWLRPLLVVGFLEAGSFKESPPFDRLPIDLTVALAGLTVLLVGWCLLQWVPMPAVVVVLGFAALAPPVLWSQAGAYGDAKMTRLFTLTLVAAVAPAVLVRSRADAARFLWVLVAVDTVVVVAVIVAPRAVATYAGAPVAALDVNTIGVGRAAGVVLVVALLALMWRAAPWYLAVGLGAAAGYALLQSGSRGPLAAVVLAVGAALLTRDRPRLGRTVPALLLGALALGGFFVAAPLYARERIATTAGGQLTGDLGTRLELYRLAADSVLGHPLGLGWGGYARVAVPGYAYPHDLPLEVLAEAGLVCGGIFLVWLVWTYATIWRVRAGFVGSAVAGLLTFGLLNALVSGDLNDNRTVFFTLGLGLAVAATAARERDGTGAADVHPPPALLTTAVPS